MVVKKVGETDLKLKFVWGFFLRTAHKSWMLLLAIRKNNTCVEELLLKLEMLGKKKSFWYSIAMLMNKLFFNLRNTVLLLGGEGSKSELI